MSKLELEIYFYLMSNGPEHLNLIFVHCHDCGLKEYLGAINNLIKNEYIKNEENILTPV